LGGKGSEPNAGRGEPLVREPSTVAMFELNNLPFQQDIVNGEWFIPLAGLLLKMVSNSDETDASLMEGRD
jgi:hypothetical protein